MNVGTFPGISLNGRGREEPRQRLVTLLSSDPSVAIPSWAQGGKGVVYVTGCGGGSGGDGSAGGGSAASAVKHPLIIPAGALTIAVTIGAGGAAGAVNNGGSTDLVIGGVNALRLGGGVATGGSPQLWNAAASAWRSAIGSAGSVLEDDLQAYSSLSLIRGRPNSTSTGGDSVFGARGAAPGESATGYGAGASTNGAGAPGFIILEFAESF